MLTLLNNRQTPLPFVWLALVALAAGCGESGPPLIPVQGKVFNNGKPAAEGGVSYYSAQNQMVQLVGAIRPDGT